MKVGDLVRLKQSLFSNGPGHRLHLIREAHTHVDGKLMVKLLGAKFPWQADLFEVISESR